MAKAGIMASMISASLAQTPRDLTAGGAIAALKADTSANPLYNETYNLGPTGLRGWIDLGAMAARSGTVPNFSSDCRKAFGAAITDAEKTGAGTLRVKRWCAGIITDVNIPMSEDTGAQENAASPVSNVESVQVTLSPSLLSAPKLFVHVRASN